MSTQDLERLEQLARATQDMSPDPGFDPWIMRRISERVPAAQQRALSAVLLACFAAAAVAAVMVSQVEQRQLDTGALSLLDSLDSPQ